MRLLTLLLAASIASGQTSSWDRFRGPNGTGLAAGDDAYPVKIGPGQGERWSRPFPAGMSSPSLSPTRLFLTGLEDDKLMTYAVDRASGETVWKREAPRPRRTKLHGKNHPAAASAAVDGDTVVVFFDEYGLLAYDHDGEQRWSLPLGPFDNIYGMAASPILVDGTVVLACDQQTGSFVLAVDAKSGEQRWRVPRPRAISGHCTPVVARPKGGQVQVVLPGSFLLDAYDLATGARVWWVEGLPSEMKSVPVILGDRLWIHGYASPLNDRGNQIELAPFAQVIAEHDRDGDGAISATEMPNRAAAAYFEWLDASRDGTLDAEEWATTRTMFAAVNSALALQLGGTGDLTSQVLWRQYRGIPQLPSPLIVDGTYYLLADAGGLLTTLSATTGERTGRTRLELAGDNYFTSPVAGGGHVYLLSESGVLTVLAAGESLEPVHTAEFEQPCYATPTLDGGQIWLRTMERLYCFGE
jgi:outer membrane protein assembly factor BamB